MSDDEEFIGFTSRKKEFADSPKKVSTSNKFVSPGVEHGESIAWTSFFLWGGIPIALIGFASFIIFVLGISSTFWSYMKIKSEAEIGNQIAKGKLSSGKSALVLVCILIPIRFLTLIVIGI